MVTKDELKTVLRLSVINKITVDDDMLVDQIINEAVETFRSYIGNRYDADTILAATGDDRDPALLRHLKAWITFDIYSLPGKNSNELIEYRYEEARRWLENIAQGKVCPANWPLLHTADNQPDINVIGGSDPPYPTDF